MIGNDTNWLPTRQSLLTRLKDWDDQCGWQDFFDTYSRLIYGTAVKAGLSSEEAQEVVQETVLSVAKKMEDDFRYDPSKGTFKGWLLQLTRWRITDQFRKRKPDNAQAGFADDERRTEVIDRMADDAPGAIDQIWETEWTENVLKAAIERVKTKVSARQFQIYDLYVLREKSVDDVTKSLGVSSTQVYLAKHRVGSALKKEMKALEARMA